jgi:uncharacterized membrane protein
MQQHVRILAWLYIIYAAIIDVVALILFAIIGGSGALSGDRNAFLSPALSASVSRSFCS